MPGTARPGPDGLGSCLAYTRAQRPHIKKKVPTFTPCPDGAAPSAGGSTLGFRSRLGAGSFRQDLAAALPLALLLLPGSVCSLSALSFGSLSAKSWAWIQGPQLSHLLWALSLLGRCRCGGRGGYSHTDAFWKASCLSRGGREDSKYS